MCGIAGVANTSDGDRVLASLMNDLRHRGPDSGTTCRIGGCSLGVRRLAVRGDDAPNPVTIAETGRVVALNGEIYRWPFADPAAPAFPVSPAEEVRAFIAASDRSVAPDGMYAIADVSPGTKRLALARDPFGIKPLFWCADGDALIFASETRAIRRAASRRPAISLAAIDDILAFGGVVGCRSVYRPIRSVERGTSLTFDLASAPAAPAASAHHQGATGGRVDLRTALRRSLEACLYTQRRLGLALSGGLDSSILAWELNALGVEGLTTVSVHVADQRDGVRALEELQLPPNGSWTTWKHVNVEVGPRDFLDLLVESVQALDAPHRMTSAPLAIALARVAACEGVVVLLTGEGPDELFFGYSSHPPFFDAVAAGDDVLSSLAGFACPPARRRALRSMLPKVRLDAALDRFGDRFGRLRRAAPPDALREVEIELSLGPLLTRTDHCFMRYGIEGRMPFLHGAVPQLARDLAAGPDARANGAKAVVRAAWAGVLPDRLLRRSKVPFRAPLTAWAADRRMEWLNGLLATGGRELAAFGLTPPDDPLAGAPSAESMPLAFVLGTIVVWARELTPHHLCGTASPTEDQDWL